MVFGVPSDVCDSPSERPYGALVVFAVDFLMDAHSLPTILLIIQFECGTVSCEDVGCWGHSAELTEVAMLIFS